MFNYSDKTTAELWEMLAEAEINQDNLLVVALVETLEERGEKINA